MGLASCFSVYLSTYPAKNIYFETIFLTCPMVKEEGKVAIKILVQNLKRFQKIVDIRKITKYFVEKHYHTVFTVYAQYSTCMQ
jgi:hypothetical protein